MYHICHCILFGCPASFAASRWLAGIAFPMICWQITFRCCSLSPNPIGFGFLLLSLAIHRLLAHAQHQIFQIHFQNKHFTSIVPSLPPPPFALCLFVCSECHCVCHWVCVCEVVCMCCSVASVANQFKSFAVAVSTERKWSTSSSRSFPSLVHAVSYAAKETQRSAACSTREIQQKMTKLASGSEGVKRKMSCENTQEKQLQLEYSQLNCQIDRQKCNVIFYYNIIY